MYAICIPPTFPKAECRRSHSLVFPAKSAQRRVNVAGGVATERLNTGGLPRMLVILLKTSTQTGEVIFRATLHGRFIR
jgi:hypothetical protein